MKIETLQCLNYKQDNETLILTVETDSIQTIESELAGKSELSIYTDNLIEPQLVEKFYDYALLRSIEKDFLADNYIVKLARRSRIEIELAQLKEKVEVLQQIVNS